MVEEIQLGQFVKDEISCYAGYVTTIGEHITGCTRIGVRGAGEDDSPVAPEEEFFYPAQLEIVDDGRVEEREEAVTETDFELGERVRDEVTNFEGIVVVINYSLWNCPSIAVQGLSNEHDERGELEWFDAPRLAEVPGADYVGDYEDVQNSTIEGESGAIEDSSNMSLSSDRL